MATGVSGSLVSGSEEDYDITNDSEEFIEHPCVICFSADNKQVESTHFCVECGCNICESCDATHKKFPTMARHERGNVRKVKRKTPPSLPPKLPQRPTCMPKTEISSASKAETATASQSVTSSAQKKRNARTLYYCEAENNTELSFNPNQIIQNVRPSREPGWLEGTLYGRTGLIPENYVEYLD